MPITLTFPVWILLGCLVCSLGACVGLIFGACFRVGKDKPTCETCKHGKEYGCEITERVIMCRTGKEKRSD